MNGSLGPWLGNLAQLRRTIHVLLPCLCTSAVTFLASDIGIYWLAYSAYHSVTFDGQVFYPNPKQFVDDWFDGAFYIILGTYLLLIILGLYFGGRFPVDGTLLFMAFIFATVSLVAASRYCVPAVTNTLPRLLGNGLARLEQAFVESTKSAANGYLIWS